jgi:lysophospholipase L1-like esterase
VWGNNKIRKWECGMKIKKIMVSLLAISVMSLGFVTSALGANGNVTVAFGDSNTQGANWESNNYDPAKKWVNKLQLNRPMINSGIAGNTTGMGKARLQSILNQNPKTVTIMFGTNDGLLRADSTPKTSYKKFESDLNYMVDMLQSKKINVVLMTTTPVIEEGKGYFYSRHNKNLYSKYGGAREFQDNYNDITRKIAREQGVPLVDTYRTFLRYTGGIDTDKSWIDSGLIDSSGTHLSAYGAEVLYRTVKTTLESNKY